MHNAITSGAASSTAGNMTTTSVTAPAAAPVAPLIEPPTDFGHVSPGIYRCSASALTQGLPPAPKGWRMSTSTRQTPQQPSWKDGNGGLFSAQPLVASASSSSYTNPSATGKMSKNITSVPSNGIHSHQAGVLHSSSPLTSTSFSSSLMPTNQHLFTSAPLSSSLSANALPTEAFLYSLQLRTILFLGPEKKPPALAAWCAMHRIRLIHLGLGALADDGGCRDDRLVNEQSKIRSGAFTTADMQYDAAKLHMAATEGVTGARGPSLMNGAKFDPIAIAAAGIQSGRDDGANQMNRNQSQTQHQRIRVSQTWWEPNGATAASPADRMSLERIAKDSLELLLDRQNLPCLICDMTGVNETGIVVGCLRRLQRFNFASVRLEYRTWAANRARASHERFIEMFDTDLITIPSDEILPEWFSHQLKEDEAEEAKLMDT